MVVCMCVFTRLVRNPNSIFGHRSWEWARKVFLMGCCQRSDDNYFIMPIISTRCTVYIYVLFSDFFSLFAHLIFLTSQGTHAIYRLQTLPVDVAVDACAQLREALVAGATHGVEAVQVPRGWGLPCSVDL